jgi:hypothetical protein
MVVRCQQVPLLILPKNLSFCGNKLDLIFGIILILDGSLGLSQYAISRNDANPIVSIECHLLSVQSASKTALLLRKVVALKTQGRKIAQNMIRGIVVNVMDLNRLPLDSADTARPIRKKQDLCGRTLWHGRPGFTK